MQTSNHNPLETQPIGRLIIRFAIPSVIAMVVNSLYNIVDQIFIGQSVGVIGNGATNVVFPFTVLALSLALLLGNGAAAYLSLMLGEGKMKEAKKGVGNALTSLVVVSALFLAVGIFFLSPLLDLFGATEQLRPYAMAYGGIIVIGLPFSIISTGINAIIRADGSPRFAMFSMVLGAVLNTILDPIFIFVFDMGIEGAAIATVIGQIASFAVSVAYLRRMQNIPLEKSDLRLSLQSVLAISKLGLSSFITQFSIVIVIAVLNQLLVTHGAASKYGAEIPMAVHGIVMKVYSILTAILVGVGQGAQPIIGYNQGAGNTARVKQTLRMTILIATLVGAIATIAFQVFPQQIMRLFGSGDALYNEFAMLDFRVFLMFAILNGFQVVAGIFLQSIGEPTKAAITSLSRQIIISLPASVLLSGLFGVEGVLYAGPVSDVLSFGLAVVMLATSVRHLSEGKSRASVPGEAKLAK